MGYAFISYSTKNQSEADALKVFLNKNGVQTWMAPGDIPPGFQYPQVINKAIKGCSCFVLLLSNYSQESNWVPRELEQAVKDSKMIVPIQIEDLVLNDQFSFLIGPSHVVVVKKIDGDSEEVKKALKSIKLCCENDLDTSLLSNDICSDEVSRDKEDAVPNTSLIDSDFKPYFSHREAQQRGTRTVNLSQTNKRKKDSIISIPGVVGMLILTVLYPILNGKILTWEVIKQFGSFGHALFMCLPAVVFGIILLFGARRRWYKGFYGTKNYVQVFWPYFGILGSVASLVYMIILRNDLSGFQRFFEPFLFNLLPTCICFLFLFLSILL